MNARSVVGEGVWLALGGGLMGWGRLGYRQRIDTGSQAHGGGQEQQTRKPTEAG